MDEVSVAQEFQRAGQLLEEVSDNDLVEGTTGRVRVLGNHVSGEGMIAERVASRNEHGQVAQGAVFHDQIDVGRGFLTVDESHDVGVMEALENVDLRVQVFLESPVELGQVD